MRGAYISPTWVARGIVFAALFYFMGRAVQYAIIDSFGPLGLAAILFTVVILALFSSERFTCKVVKLFGFILMIYGTVRISVGALLKIAPIDSMHAIESTSMLYFLVSILFFCSGFYLIKHPVILNKSRI